MGQHLRHGRGRGAAEARGDLRAAADALQRGSGHAPRFARRRVAARHRDRRQVADARNGGAVDQQQLAAPCGAVVAEADAVEREAEQRAVDAVLGRDRRHVRVVVLHGMRRQAPRVGVFEREAGAEEVGVQVVRDGLRLDVEHRAQVIDHLDQRAAGGRVVEVADMRRQEGLVTAGDADRVLQPGARGQHRRARARQLDRPRRVAARAADELRAAGGRQAQHAVVAAGDDVAVVQQQRVGDALQPRQRLVVADHQRLAVRVGAGHHQQQGLRLVQPGRAGRAAGRFMEQQGLDRACRAASCRARRGPAPRRRAARHSRPASAAARSAARPTAAGPAPRRRPAPSAAADARLAAITANGFSSRCLRSRSSATAAALRASHAR